LIPHKHISVFRYLYISLKMTNVIHIHARMKSKAVWFYA